MAAVFLQQRLYPTLQLGLLPQVSFRRRKQSFHCRQGDWDSGCGFHCIAMSLALLGYLGNIRALAGQRTGTAGKLWGMAKEGYFAGIEGDKLAAGLTSLGLGLDVDYVGAKHGETLVFTQQRLDAGDLVILGVRNPRRQLDHWVLVLGMEGMQKEAEFDPHTLLVMDPSCEEPWMCGYNGRLDLNTHPITGKPSYVRYTTNDGTRLPITFGEAVSIGRRPQPEQGRTAKGGGKS